MPPDGNQLVIAGIFQVAQLGQPLLTSRTLVDVPPSSLNVQHVWPDWPVLNGHTYPNEHTMLVIRFYLLHETDTGWGL